jgi:prepilin-type N-terminal cleavage/methylation domain-containing protein
MCGRLHRWQRGLSLVEVLIAVVIIAMGLLAIAGTLGWVSRSGAKMRYQKVALTLAESELATLEAKPDLPSTPITRIVSVGKPVSDLPRGATMLIYSEPYPTPTEKRLRRVRIEIRWGVPGDPLSGRIVRERLICLR